MILTQRELAGLESEAITCAFRRWKRPSVKSGGTLLTAVGLVQIREVRAVTADEITDAGAHCAGHASAAALAEALARGPEGHAFYPSTSGR